MIYVISPSDDWSLSSQTATVLTRKRKKKKVIRGSNIVKDIVKDIVQCGKMTHDLKVRHFTLIVGVGGGDGKVTVIFGGGDGGDDAVSE